MTSHERAARAIERPAARAQAGAQQAGAQQGRADARWALALACGAFVAVWNEPAPAQTEHSPARANDDLLVWQAPVGCSTAAAVRERVTELVGQQELERERVHRVEGRVSETREGWELHLTLVDALGTRQRRLSSPHCADLAEAAAVAISIAFEAARARERAEQHGAAEVGAADGSQGGAISPAPSPAPAPSPDAAEPAVLPEAESRDPSAFAPWLGAELWLDAHALPAAAAGVSAVGALRAIGWRLGVFAGWLPGVERSVAPGQGVSFSLLIAGGRACYALGHGILDTALCAGFEAGRLSARGASLMEARSASDLWLAPQLGLELDGELGSHVALQLRAEAFAPLLRQGYAVNETDDVHHVPSVGARVALGVLFGL